MSIKSGLWRSFMLWTAFAFIYFGLELNALEFFSPQWFFYFIGTFTIVFVINDVADGAHKRGDRE